MANSGGSHNGDTRGNRSPYEINTWNSPNDRRTGAIHCVHMRGLPFKATQLDVFEVCFHTICFYLLILNFLSVFQACNTQECASVEGSYR